MKAEEFCRELLAGKKLRRACWKNGNYWHIDKDTGKIVNSIGIAVDNWEIFEVPEPAGELYIPVSTILKHMDDLNRKHNDPEALYMLRRRLKI